MNFTSVDELLTHFGTGRRPIDDPFFKDAHDFCNVFKRTGISADDIEDSCQRSIEEFRCSAANCDEIFQNLAEFEIHYNSAHRYTCRECKVTRPNARLLEIHIQEVHDSFFQVCSTKRPMYQCYNPDCDETFFNPAERQMHCASVHKFPENFLSDGWNVKRSTLMEVEDDSGEHENKASCKNFFGARKLSDSMEPD